MTVEEIVNSWNVQLEQDATKFTNEAVKVFAPLMSLIGTMSKLLSCMPTLSKAYPTS